jgi:hypothetical protein
MKRYCWSNMSDMMEPDDRGAYYYHLDVDAAMQEKDAEIAELKEKLASALTEVNAMLIMYGKE